MKAIDLLCIGIFLSLPFPRAHAEYLEVAECDSPMNLELSDLIHASKKGILDDGDKKSISSFCDDTVKLGQYKILAALLRSTLRLVKH